MGRTLTYATSIHSGAHSSVQLGFMGTHLAVIDEHSHDGMLDLGLVDENERVYKYNWVDIRRPCTCGDDFARLR